MPDPYTVELHIRALHGHDGSIRYPLGSIEFVRLDEPERPHHSKNVGFDNWKTFDDVLKGNKP